MKTCVTCKIEKPLDEFNKLAKSADGTQPRCRDCHKVAYRANPKKQIARVAVRNKRVRAALRNKIWDLKRNPCVDCGIQYHPVAMDFDHMGSDKLAHVSRFLSDVVLWDVIEREIAKCELVCANCHRVRTFSRSGVITE